MDIAKTVARQRRYFATGATLNLQTRIRALRRLDAELRRREKDILEAIRADLGKTPFESYMTELGLTLDELRYQLKHLRRFSADTPVRTPLTHFPARSFVRKAPYGVVLVMSPWNYPFMLSLEPVIGAVAAGNCVVLKPSAYSPATSAVLREICTACFTPGHVTVIEGGREQNSALLDEQFDYIFFTGGSTVGRLVMEKASGHLTPVSLELGGKSPCIVDETADIAVAAKRIAFGKWLNAGQTCVAPDYVLVHQSVEKPLLAALEQATCEFLGKNPLENPELPKIINQKHFERLNSLLEGQTVYMGGENDDESRIAPTVLVDVNPQSPVMQEEIFGPILPVLGYQSLGQAIAFVNARPHPLALYLFTQSKSVEQLVLDSCRFGGGCVNDTVVHIATSHMGFGGVGESGMGSYHGKRSFDTFTHEKSILKKYTWLDIPVRYHPYTPLKQGILRTLLR